MEIHYLGWSGLTFRDGGTMVVFDPFGEAAGWDALGDASCIILCATHGHPEHVGSLKALLAEMGTRRSHVHVVSSPAVLRHLGLPGLLPAEQVHPVQVGDRVSISGTQMEAFAWRHMTLLPPGLGAKGRYALALLRHPAAALRIGLDGLHSPLRAPTLGYHVTFASGATVLNCSEGAHRATPLREMEALGQRLPSDLVTFAVEPEDVDAIPSLLRQLQTTTAVLYEAHRPWRDRFGLPIVDLASYRRALADEVPELRVIALTKPGQSEGVDEPDVVPVNFS